MFLFSCFDWCDILFVGKYVTCCCLCIVVVFINLKEPVDANAKAKLNSKHRSHSPPVWRRWPAMGAALAYILIVRVCVCVCVCVCVLC
jgi:hypothetical protein